MPEIKQHDDILDLLSLCNRNDQKPDFIINVVNNVINIGHFSAI